MLLKFTYEFSLAVLMTCADFLSLSFISANTYGRCILSLSTRILIKTLITYSVVIFTIHMGLT